MKFIKELIANKNWNSEPLDREAVEHDLQEGGFESPLVARKAHAVDEDDWPEHEDVLAQASLPSKLPEQDETRLTQPMEAIPASAPLASEPKPAMAVDDANADLKDIEHFLDGDEANLDFDLDFEDDDEPEEWDIGLDDDMPEPRASSRIEQPFEEPESVDEDFDIGDLASAFSEPDTAAPAFQPVAQEQVPDIDFDDEFSFDEEESVHIEAAALEAVETEAGLSDDEKEALIIEIRRAIKAVRHIRSDSDLSRVATARDLLGDEDGTDGRILAATDSILNEDVGARRRKAIALMKAAAAATRSDPKLQNMVGRDPTADPTEQHDYRQDLSQVELPRLQPNKVRPMAVTEAADEPVALDDADDVPAMEDETQTTSDETAAMSQWMSSGSDDDADDELPQKSARSTTESLRAALLEAPATDEFDEDPEPETGSAWDAWSDDDDADDADILPAAAFAGPDPKPEPVVQVPTPALGRASRGAGRVKTRLLGFQQNQGGPEDMFDDEAAAPSGSAMFPVGWLVVTDGPGRGHSFALSAGVSQIGRGEDQTVRLDFGDNAISRQNHAAIAFDDEQNSFYLGHGGKSNLVRLNGKPVLATEELQSHDEIRLGETRMLFIALCGREFSWSGDQEGTHNHAAIA